jgi:hypothetical protein
MIFCCVKHLRFVCEGSEEIKLVIYLIIDLFKTLHDFLVKLGKLNKNKPACATKQSVFCNLTATYIKIHWLLNFFSLKTQINKRIFLLFSAKIFCTFLFFHCSVMSITKKWTMFAGKLFELHKIFQNVWLRHASVASNLLCIERFHEYKTLCWHWWCCLDNFILNIFKFVET